VGASCQDDHGHGTHVTGIVAALDNDIDVVGVAPKATPYCVKVLDSTFTGSDSNVIAGLDWVFSNNAILSPPIRAVNMSLGRNGTLNDNPALRAAVSRLYDLGISLSVNTDGRTLTNTNLTQEYEQLHRCFGWDKHRFLHCNLEALRASFLPERARQRLAAQLQERYQNK